MQQTRQYLLDILREQGEATVEDLVLLIKTRIDHSITAVTVRHHLDVLRSEALVTEPKIRRRHTPGRPQFVYALTDKARDHFPNNYQTLINVMFEQVKATLPTPQVNVIVEGMADQMVASANIPAVPLAARLDYIINYLNQHGYDASWERTPEGIVLHTRNCPYHHIVGDHAELCTMDMRLISGLTGVVPRALGRLTDHAESCAYLLPHASLIPTNLDPVT